uniref:Cytochrome P450 family 46 subfamily A member 1 n=1 Tax=Neogobius melanostomus TaxID=47308 RepID=A0A8C6SL71_9GOBI
FVAFLGYCIYIKHLHLKYDHIPGPPRQRYACVSSVVIMRVSVVSVPSCLLFHHLFTFLGSGLVTAQQPVSYYVENFLSWERTSTSFWTELSQKLMDKLSEEAESSTVASMLRMFNSVTLDVITTVAFGIDLDLLKYASPYPKAIETCLKGMCYYIRDASFQVNVKFIYSLEACRLLRRTGAQWINERKTAIQNGEEVPRDILTQIIKSDKIANTKDEEFMLDNFVTFFIAGQETTANQLAFCLMELGRHPDILEKLKKEIDDVLGMKREITYDDLGNLTYLTQVLKETLRMYPTITGTSRELPEDMVIGGIHIPGGVTVMFSTYVTGRMEKFFKDPQKFDPERFHPDAPKHKTTNLRQPLEGSAAFLFTHTVPVEIVLPVLQSQKNSQHCTVFLNKCVVLLTEIHSG